MPLERKPAAPAEKTEVAPVEKVEKVERAEPEPNKVFELAGRPELATFFNEHIVDIILHRDRYKALGIEFPSAVILYGPPGTGKTFAVERLVDFLGWPSFQRSEEHTSELQSLMRISYAVFCLKKQISTYTQHTTQL